MDFILTLLGCLFVGTIVSLITLAIIHSKNYEKDFNKSWIISTIVIGILLFGLDFLYNSKISETESLKSEIEIAYSSLSFSLTILFWTSCLSTLYNLNP